MSEFSRRLEACVKALTEHPDLFREQDPMLDHSIAWIMEGVTRSPKKPSAPTALNRNAQLQLDRLRQQKGR